MEKSITADIKSKPFTSNENFAELLEESLKKETKKVGSLVKGIVVELETAEATIDVVDVLSSNKELKSLVLLNVYVVEPS